MKTAIVLAGGQGSRLNYREKALLELRGKPILLHILERLSRSVDDFIIVARDRDQQSKLQLIKLPADRSTVVYDEIPGFGPIAGIYTGLKVSKASYSFVVACDMPYINSNVVDLLFSKACGYDVAIPYPPEPLHAVYKRDVTIQAAKKAIREGKGAVMYVIDQLRANFVPKEEIQTLDPNLCTFLNINREQDIKRLDDLAICE
ncbi:MAG: molybdenum cofactor guanylyltransferase [Halobacteriota archaeon]